MLWYEEAALMIASLLAFTAGGFFVADMLLRRHRRKLAEMQPIDWGPDHNLGEPSSDGLEQLSREELLRELRIMIDCRDDALCQLEATKQNLANAQTALIHQAMLKRRYYAKLKKAGLVRTRKPSYSARMVMQQVIPQIPKVPTTAPIHIVKVDMSQPIIGA